MRTHNPFPVLALSLLLATACQPAIQDVTVPVPTSTPPAQQSPASPAAVTPSGQGETALPPAAPPSLESINLDLAVIARGLDEPVGIANAGDGSGRLFIVEKGGTIRVVQDGALVSSPFLDI